MWAFCFEYCVQRVCLVPTEALEPLGLELQVALTCHVGPLQK